MNILVSWIGKADLNASQHLPETELGPLGQAVKARHFDTLYLLSDYSWELAQKYQDWLKSQSSVPVSVTHVELSSPTCFREIYESARNLLKNIVKNNPDARLTFHLSPGTPIMATVWILLGKTRFPAELIQSSVKHGVQTASVPMDIAADFIPDLFLPSDSRLAQLSAGHPPVQAGFGDIIYRSDVMLRLIHRAAKVAMRSVPVLIEGESGTGKELLARAIHKASLRSEGPFVTINCGAIPGELLESELFGHEKGAFTGAVTGQKGFFEEADGGTLFLDEVGELPEMAQVKLLRVLQEGEVQSVGSRKVKSLDVRIVAATNRSLVEQTIHNEFRSDLFYRLAVAVLNIPPLRERHGDLSLLIDTLWAKVNESSREDPSFTPKKISAGAKNRLMTHHWPGNVRELLNTLQRVVIWTEGERVTRDDVEESIILLENKTSDNIMGRSLEKGFCLQDTMGEVAGHYIAEALRTTKGNKTKAANMLGLPNYQTLNNWIKKYGVRQEIES